MTYSQKLRRIRDEKTNYRKRGTMLMGKRNFITVLISNENTLVQIYTPNITGDLIKATAHSHYLLDKGWKGSRKNISAAYLTGYLAGKKAMLAGITDAILYSGTRKYTQRMASALKGVIDAGINVPADSDTFPTEQRIQGEHLFVKNNVSEFKNTIDGDIK